MSSDRICLVCGRKSTMFNTCLKISEGRWICSDCNLYTGIVNFRKLRGMTDDEIIEAVTVRKGKRSGVKAATGSSIRDRVNASNAGKDNTAASKEGAAADENKEIIIKGLLGESLTVDRRTKTLSFLSAPTRPKDIPVPAVYNFDDIIAYKLEEDKSSFVKKEICRSMKVKITVKDERERDIYIHILNNAHEPLNSDKYKRSEKTARQILMLLQDICMSDKKKENEQSASLTEESKPNMQEASVPDMLREYKKLLDEGVITQEEFEAKKAQLLGVE